MSDPTRPKLKFVEIRFFFSLVCLLVIVARANHPEWFDDVLDYVPIGLAALPWLGFFVTEVKLPGGIEAKLAALTEEEKAAEAKAEAAQKDAAETKVEARLMAVAPPLSLPTALKGMTQSSDVAAMASRYNSIRATMPSGAARTSAMSAVLREMVAAASADMVGTDQADHARSTDEGLRLAAAAWAVAHPDLAAPAPLIDALYASTHPFVHYWLLMALDQMAERQGRSAFSADMLNRLQAFRPHAATGADRVWLLESILRRLGQPVS